MAKSPKVKTKKRGLRGWVRAQVRLALLWAMRGLVIGFGLSMLWIAIYGFVNPPTTIYMMQEKSRVGAIKQDWVPLDQIAPAMQRSVVAAEDANYCSHWGFDMSAIRAAIAEGGRRGGSTISQQVVKNTFLWHGRTWTRKSLEAALTPMVELVWTKRRILEVYLNVAEMDEGVFGAEAAARKYFGVGPDQLSARQAALIAAVLPNPKERSARKPSNFVQRRARQIQDGAATIRADGRADCFED